jgi:hypothetical protein
VTEQAITTSREIPFRSRVDWDSFNELAKEVGSAGLRQLEPGTLAHLRVKQDAFVLAREEDFQRLVGLAADATRLQQIVATLVEGIDLAAERQDAKILTWIQGVAQQMAGSISGDDPRQNLITAMDEDAIDADPAPRTGRRLAMAGGG